MAKIPKKLRKKLNQKKAVFTELETKAYFLEQQMGEGLTLQEVAVIRGVPYSQLMSEIQEHPRLIQAMKDGKEAGGAYWIKKLKKDMYNPVLNASLFKLFMGNYMDWWDRPIEDDFDENTIVEVHVSKRKPTKAEKKGMELAKEMAK